jgi:16S rRNA (uracil1498-N3)-methyltransferase
LQLFFDPDIQEGGHVLREVEAIHAGRVLRKRAGDELHVVDGRGGWYRATVEAIDKRSCTVTARLVRREERRADHHLQLIVAPTKGIDRFEWLVEKATEIGVDHIQPVLTTHGERKRLRTDRLQRVAESAMKQSLRAWLPTIGELVPFAEVIKADSDSDSYLGYLAERGSPLLRDQYRAGRSVRVAIGPEGGFSPEEAERARRAGFDWASLGPHRLRTETAALLAVQTIASANW